MDSWEDFWKDKSRRKLYLKICDKISSVESCKSRHWFLSQCVSLGVCPRTLRCNTVPPRMFSEISMKKWSDVKRETESKYVSIGREECEVEINRLEEDLATRKINIVLGLSPEFQVLVGEKFTQIHNSSFQKSRFRLEAKLRSLLLEDGKEVAILMQDSLQTEEPEFEVPGRNSRRRKFINKEI